MRQFRLALAALVLFVIFPVTLLAFRHRERLDAIVGSAAEAERKGQFRLAASILEKAGRSVDPTADLLLGVLNFFRISAPTRAGMLYQAAEMHANACISHLVEMKENPTLLADAHAALDRLTQGFGGSEAARAFAGRLGLLDGIQSAQTLVLESNDTAAIALLRPLKVPAGEPYAMLRFLRARLLGLAYLARYKAERRPGDLRGSLDAFEYCFGIDADDRMLNFYYREAEALELERIAERIPYRDEPVAKEAPRAAPDR